MLSQCKHFQEKEQKLVSNYLFREVPDVLDVDPNDASRVSEFIADR